MRKAAADVLHDRRLLSLLDSGGAGFLAGLVLGIVAGCAVKARPDAVSLTPSRALDHDPKELSRRLRAIGGWEWDEDDECWVSHFPGG